MSPERDLDVLVIGAGLAGVGAGWHLQHDRPGTTWAILEARDVVGGTWDVFRFPGVRSDSDMQTLSYPFRPWRRSQTLGSGAAIREYIQDTARVSGVDELVHFGTRVVSASWSSDTARWTVEAVVGEERQTWTCSVLYTCTGFFDHENAYVPDFPGIADFAGEVVHPQFWPADLDLAGRRVVVIGSGATAVTIVPALVDDGADVTMLQRSPSWVLSVASRDRVGALAGRLPDRAAYRLRRTRNAFGTIALYELTRRRPALARWFLRRGMAAIVTERVADEHFTPRYDPWDQRLCVAPDGDFLHVVADGRAQIVTDHVQRFEPEGIRLGSGRLLEADVVVTATGLTLKPLGGIDVSVDGQPVDVGDCVAYRGCMLGGIPNLFICMGYINASWTLRNEVSHEFVCRVLTFMDEHGYASATPKPPPPQQLRPLMALASGYVLRGAAAFPKQGEHPPWTLAQNWFTDRRAVARARIDQELTFATRASGARRAS